MKNKNSGFEFFSEEFVVESALEERVRVWQQAVEALANQALRAGDTWPVTAPGRGLLTGAEQLLVHVQQQEDSLLAQAAGQDVLEEELVCTQYLLEGTAKALEVACADLARMDTDHKLHFTFALDELRDFATEIKCLYNPFTANLFAPTL